MYCSQCGTQGLPGQMFCSKCGHAIADGAVPAAGSAPTPDQSSPSEPGSPPSPGPVTGCARPERVERHLAVLGALWIVLSGLRLIPGIALAAFGHMHFPFMLMPIPEEVRLFLTPFLGAIGLVIIAFAIGGGIAGWGLLARRPWARMLAIVLACVSLMHFPFGTALGIYTLWVLIPQGGEAEYHRLAKAN